MIKNYLVVALRNLIKHKTFSLINILGFAFSISICLMIVLFIMKEESFDRYNVNADQIYRLTDTDNNSSAIDYRVKQAIVDNFPEVKHGCLVQIVRNPIETSNKGNGYYIDNIMSVDNAFFEMFTVHFIYGNSSKPFQNPNSVVLTESAARIMFGKENSFGKGNHAVEPISRSGYRSNTRLSGQFEYQCQHHRQCGE